MNRSRIPAILGGPPLRQKPPSVRPRLSAEEHASIIETVRSGEWSTLGDQSQPISQLEASWAGAHGSKHGVAVSSGTAGLTLALMSLGCFPGDEVLIPAYGCPAVDVAVMRAGLTPIHVDITPDTYCMNPIAAAGAVNGRTAAIITVHFAGQPAAIAGLKQIATRFGLALIEDACLAPGSASEGRTSGNWGLLSVFSLGVAKPISAGEGGVILTNDLQLASRVRSFRSLGIDPATGTIAVPTGNFRLSDLQAAVVPPQLLRMEEDRSLRDRAARKIEEALQEMGWLSPLQTCPRVTQHSRAQLWARFSEVEAGISRKTLVQSFQEEGIPLHEGWEFPNHCHSMYLRENASEWLAARSSGRSGGHYERCRYPDAESAAFSEAVMFDLPILNSDEETVNDCLRACEKIGAAIPNLRKRFPLKSKRLRNHQ